MLSFVKRPKTDSISPLDRPLDADDEICGLWTDEEKVSQSTSSPPSDDEEVDVSQPSITASPAKDAVHLLWQFMECLENVDNNNFDAIFQIESMVDEQFQKRCHHATILDFFQKF